IKVRVTSVPEVFHAMFDSRDQYFSLVATPSNGGAGTLINTLFPGRTAADELRLSWDPRPQCGADLLTGLNAAGGDSVCCDNLRLGQEDQFSERGLCEQSATVTDITQCFGTRCAQVCCQRPGSYFELAEVCGSDLEVPISNCASCCRLPNG